MAQRNMQIAEAPTPAHDGLLHLSRSLNIHPDVLIGKGTGIFGAGMIGAGKTTVMARLFEQFGLCGLPFAIFDLEGDLASITSLLPCGVLASATNCPTVKELYQDGLQVVFDMASWQSADRAAEMLMTIVDGLMSYTSGLPPYLRVPFLIGIDEIAYFVPQKRAGHEHLSPEILKALHASLSTLASRGRKRGLIPCFFTQRFAHVHKDVLAPGTFILMRNTLDTDLARYLEYIDASAFGEGCDLTLRQVKARIAKFKEGQGIVKLPSGKQGVVQFYDRESEHTSHAPKTQAALNAYAHVVVDKNKCYGAFSQRFAVEEPYPEYHAKVTALPATRSGERNGENHTASDPTNGQSRVEPRVRALLEENPDYTPAQIARRANCCLVDAKKWMDRIRGIAPPLRSSVEPRVRALLEENPDSTPTQIAFRANCTWSDAKKWMDRIRGAG